LRSRDPGLFNDPTEAFAECRGKIFYLKFRNRARDPEAVDSHSTSDQDVYIDVLTVADVPDDDDERLATALMEHSSMSVLCLRERTT
jgi:hypothetical protein